MLPSPAISSAVTVPCGSRCRRRCASAQRQAGRGFGLVEPSPRGRHLVIDEWHHHGMAGREGYLPGKLQRNWVDASSVSAALAAAPRRGGDAAIAAGARIADTSRAIRRSNCCMDACRTGPAGLGEMCTDTDQSIAGVVEVVGVIGARLQPGCGCHRHRDPIV
jgi:hypothetical protein